ncbi:MAG: glutamate mutase L [Anaerolineae bacterium]|nr:glutamate mutase L [Anaerolineae bacterium]
MASEQSAASILVVDCGTVLTKAVLLDRVSGAYRFVARGQALTTVFSPWFDVIIGVQRAIEQIEDITGRNLLDEQKNLVLPQRESGTGVDSFIAVGSVARPIRVVLGGLVPELSLSSLIQAVAGTYSAVQGEIVQDPNRRLSVEDQVQIIQASRPDIVCIAGGTDGGAVIPILELVETATLACSMIEEGSRPRMLFAGNAVMRKRVAEIVGGQVELHAVDNVRPSLHVENLEGVRAELETLYRQHHLGNLPGVGYLTEWSGVPLVSSAESFSRLIQYLWYLDESPKGTLGIDLGAVNTTIAAVFEGRLSLSIHGELGSVYGGRRIMDQWGAETVLRWMPTDISEEQALGHLISKEIRPGSVPEEMEELWLEQAVAREAIREALRTARSGWRASQAQPYSDFTPLFDPILVSGSVLAGAPRPGQVAMIVLDAVEPIGVSTLLVDTNGLAPILGAVAAAKPMAAVEVLDSGGIVNLATVIAPVGIARKGEVVLGVRVHYEQGGVLDVEVSYGSLEVLPLPTGQEAVLELHPRRGFDVGLGGRGRGGKRRVCGGLLGIIVDARGRPLELPQDSEERQAQIQQWLWDVGG